MWSLWLVFCDCGFHSVCTLMRFRTVHGALKARILKWFARYQGYNDCPHETYILIEDRKDVTLCAFLFLKSIEHNFAREH